MAGCELCGRRAEKLVRAEVEGSELKVCENCGKFGKVLGEVKTEEEVKKILMPKRPFVEEESEERIVAGFAEKLRRAREKRGMKQEDFAKMLNEKESLVQKWESGNLRPRVETARKLERLLGIILIEEIEEKKGVELKGIKTGEITLGDMIKVKRRKV